MPSNRDSHISHRPRRPSTRPGEGRPLHESLRCPMRSTETQQAKSHHLDQESETYLLWDEGSESHLLHAQVSRAPGWHASVVACVAVNSHAGFLAPQFRSNSGMSTWKPGGHQPSWTLGYLTLRSSRALKGIGGRTRKRCGTGPRPKKLRKKKRAFTEKPVRTGHPSPPSGFSSSTEITG